MFTTIIKKEYYEFMTGRKKAFMKGYTLAGRATEPLNKA